MIQKGRFFGILLVFFLWQFTVTANDQITINIGKIWLKDLLGQALLLELELESENIILHASADHLSLADPSYEVQNFKLDCRQMQLDTIAYRCSDGSLSFSHKYLGYNDFNMSFVQKRSEDVTRFELNGLLGGKADINLTGKIKQDNWLLYLTAKQVDISTLLKLFQPYMSEENLTQLADWEFEGKVNLTADLQGKKDQLFQIKISVNSNDFNANDSSGKYVAEQLAFELLSTINLHHDIWQWQHQLNLSAGLSYIEPVFIDLFENAITLSAEGDWHADSQYLTVDSVLFQQKNIGQAQGYYAGTMLRADKIGLKASNIELATLYPVWLQPFLLKTAASKLEVAGDFSVDFVQADDEYQLLTGFNNVFVEDNDGKFGVAELTGTLAWTNGVNSIESLFGWKAGHLYEIALGRSEVHARVESSTLTLQQALQLPVLDGQLQINNFSLQHFPDEKISWQFGYRT